MHRLYNYYKRGLSDKKLTYKQCNDCDHGWDNDDNSDGNQFQIGFKSLYEDLDLITEWNDALSPGDELDPAVGKLEKFDQREFVQTEWADWGGTASEEGDWSWNETEFRKYGWIYTPKYCEENRCHVHLAFHGCGGNPKDMANDYEYFGLNTIAGANNIIVVYPGSKNCFNDEGKFDNDYYLTNEGLYPTTMKSMICRLTTAENSTEAEECPEAGPFKQ